MRKVNGVGSTGNGAGAGSVAAVAVSHRDGLNGFGMVDRNGWTV